MMRLPFSLPQPQSAASTSAASSEKQFLISDFLPPTSAGKSDCDALVKHLNEKEIYDCTLNIPYPYTERDAVHWLKRVEDETKKWGQSLNWAIREGNEVNDSLIGGIGFHDLSLANSHRAELGYWLAKPYWGQGIMTKAVEAVCNYAFQNLNLLRITAFIFDSNTASQRVVQKCGFRLEGILRKHYQKDGRIFDGQLYARLDTH